MMSHTSLSAPNSVVRLPPRFARRMPSTSDTRWQSAIRDLQVLEANMRLKLFSDEATHRGQLSCISVRCRSASRSANAKSRLPLQLTPNPCYGGRLPAADVTESTLEESSAAGAENCRVVVGCSSRDDEDSMKTTAASIVWELRRASAAARRQRKGLPNQGTSVVPHQTADIVEAASANTAACETSAAAARVTERDDVSTLRSLQIRCLVVELASLEFGYRSLWCCTMDEHHASLAAIRCEAAAERRILSCTSIQKTYRMHRCRHDYRQLQWQVVLLQRCGRGMQLRLSFPRFGDQERARRLMLRVLHGFRARWELGVLFSPRAKELRQRSAAVRIQSMYRCCVAKRRYWHHRRRVRAALVLQRAARGFLDRCRYLRTAKELLASRFSLDTVDIKMSELVRRRRLEVWEYETRREIMNVAVGQCSAVARRVLAVRRIAAPYAHASAVASGLLAASVVGRACDYQTPSFHTIFDAHRAGDITANNRPASSAASRRKQLPNANQTTVSFRGRLRLQLLLQEAEEAVARRDVELEHFAFVEFVKERHWRQYYSEPAA